MVVDSEEEFHSSEILKLQTDINPMITNIYHFYILNSVFISYIKRKI